MNSMFDVSRHFQLYHAAHITVSQLQRKPESSVKRLSIEMVQQMVMKQECSFKSTFKCIVPVSLLVEQGKYLHNKLEVISNTNNHEQWFREGRGPGVQHDIHCISFVYQHNLQKTTTRHALRLGEYITVKILQEITPIRC